MTNHLTEDQLSRWFIGQTTMQEQRHVQGCGPCSAEIDRFLSAMVSFKAAVTIGAERLTHRRAPTVSTVLNAEKIAAPLFGSLESINDFRRFRWLSLVVHALVLALLILPGGPTQPLASVKTLVMLYSHSVPTVFNLPSPDTSGGGGGGRKTLTPPSRGVLPRGADKQVVPPLVEPKNFSPELVVESTIVAPPLPNLHPLDIRIGDPNGVVGPPSAGPGRGGGIGSGDGTGVGNGRGPGAGAGEGGGRPGVYNVGGGITAPVIRSQVQPEYSDDARKGRIQGTVELLVVVRPDGTVQIDSVSKSLGYGLDEKAIAAVRQWKFDPGRRNGQPVATFVSVFVNFSLR